MHSESRCQHVKANGKRCQAIPRASGCLCIFHDPAMAAKRAEGRRRGGKVRSQPAAVLSADTPDLPLKSVADVAALLGRTINYTLRGEIDPRVANAVGVLTSILLKALQGTDLEEHLAKVEQEQKPPPFNWDLVPLDVRKTVLAEFRRQQAARQANGASGTETAPQNGTLRGMATAGDLSG